MYEEAVWGTAALAGASLAHLAAAAGFGRWMDLGAVALAGGVALTAARRVWLLAGAMRPFLFPSYRPPSGALPFWVGRSTEGELVWATLEALPHLMLGGQTGAGKSNFLRQMLTGWALWCQPNTIGVLVIDLKHCEFNYAAAAPQLLRIGRDEQDAAALLTAASRAVDARLDALDRSGVTDISELEEPLGRLVVIIDEMAELQQYRELLRLIERLARLGRACGVHLVLCTQRPDHLSLPGSIKANLPATLALRCMNALNSRILLDDDAAAHLPVHPKGRAVWQWERRVVVQTPLLPSGEARRMVNAIAATA